MNILIEYVLIVFSPIMSKNFTARLRFVANPGIEPDTSYKFNSYALYP